MAAKPRAPAGLGPRGRRFWRDVLAVFELQREETELLVEIVRALDVADALNAAVIKDGAVVNGRVHQAVSAARSNMLAVGRLLAQLALPDPDGVPAVERETVVRARRAANERWRMERQRRGAA